MYAVSERNLRKKAVKISFLRIFIYFLYSCRFISNFFNLFFIQGLSRPGPCSWRDLIGYQDLLPQPALQSLEQ